MFKQAIACIALSAGSLFAQCNTIELEPIVPAPPSVEDNPSVEWLDPDGPAGPIEPYMVHSTVVLDGSPYAHLFRKGPYGWAAVSEMSDVGYRHMLGIKQGAAGLQVGHIVFYGYFGRFDPAGPRSVTIYDGTESRLVGSSQVQPAFADVDSAVEWDADGSGPEAPILLIAGEFTSIGGVPARYIASYDGKHWREFDVPFPRPCRLEVLDPDGDGPQRPQLFALERPYSGSNFTGVYRLDRAGQPGTWEYHGVPFGAIAFHDDDGPGPNQTALFHVERTSGPNGGITLRKRIDDQWQLVPVQCERTLQGLCYFVSVTRMESFDPDGAGPLVPELALAGSIENPLGGQSGTFAVIRNGRVVIPPNNPVDYTVNTPSEGRVGLSVLKPFDPDGPGPRGIELLLSGGVSPGIMTWNGRELRKLDIYFEGGVRHMIHHDVDGDGPEPAQIFGTGTAISHTGFEPAENMVVWKNGRWRGLRGTVRSDSSWITPNALKLHDFDGPGPAHSRIIASGDHPHARGLSWNHQTKAWEIFVAKPLLNIYFTNLALHSFDEDGPGSRLPILFYGGLVEANNLSMSTVVRVENGRWYDSEDLDGYQVCHSLASHDPDGTGPGIAMMLASFNTGLHRWTGIDWIRFAGVTSVENSNTAHDLISVDLDGSGPRPIELIYGVKEFSIGTTVYRGIHAYDGVSWRHVGGTIPSTVRAVRRLFMFDHDGPDGPAPEQLAMTCFPRGVYRLENNQWIELETGYGASFRSVITHIPGVDGPGPGELFLAGGYTPPNSYGGRTFAHYKLLDLAQIVQHPAAVDSSSSQAVTLSVNATGEELRYQWYRGATPVQNGPGGASVGGGTVSGAQGPILTITGINCSDAGSFSCTVSNGCSSANSSAAAVTLRDCCTPDYNGDGGADTSDILDLAHDVASGTSTYPPNSPDFNADGAADTTDILDLANVIAGGDCP